MMPLIGSGLGAALLGAAVAIASSGIAFVVGIRRAVLAVFLVRSLCDPFFGLTKPEFGTAMGIGSAMNALVISFALLFFLQSPASIGSAILPWAGFLMSAFASAIVSPEPMNASRYFLWFVSYAAVFALPFGMIRSGKWALRCLIVVLYSSLIPVAYAFVEFAWNALTGVELGVQSTFAHPNIFGFYLVTVLSLVLFMLSSSLVSAPVRLKRWLILYLPIIIFVLLLTRGRSPWIAATIILTVYASTIDKRYLLCLALIPFAIYYVPGVEERLLDLQSGNYDYGYAKLNSYAWRKVLWTDTLDWMMAQPLPLFGYGLASFEYYAPFFFPRAGGMKVGLHNIYLQMFFEMGIFGLLTFIWLFVVLFMKLKKGYSSDKAGSIIMMTLALSFLIVSFSDNMLGTLVIEWYFWFLMGVFCAWNRLSVQRPSKGAFYGWTEKSRVRLVSEQQGMHAN